MCAPGGGPRRINRLVHGVHNVFPEMVEPAMLTGRSSSWRNDAVQGRSLVVLMTNLFDELSADVSCR